MIINPLNASNIIFFDSESKYNMITKAFGFLSATTGFQLLFPPFFSLWHVPTLQLTFDPNAKKHSDTKKDLYRLRANVEEELQIGLLLILGNEPNWGDDPIGTSPQAHPPPER